MENKIDEIIRRLNGINLSDRFGGVEDIEVRFLFLCDLVVELAQEIKEKA